MAHWSLLGSLREYRRDKVGLLNKTMRKDGDLAYLRIGLRRVYLASSPATLSQVLESDRNDFKTAKSYAQLQRLIGKGLVTTSGEEWRRHRHLLEPLFDIRRLAFLVPLVEQCTRDAMSSWYGASANASVDLHASMLSLSMKIASAALFGANAPGHEFEIAFRDAESYLMERIEAFLPIEVPSLRLVRFYRARALLRRYIQQTIQSSVHQNGILAGMKNLYEDGQPAFRGPELRDEALTLFLASYETTGAALFWLLYLVARHADVKCNLQLELAQRLGDRPLTLESLSSLRYCASVVTEALRLYPPIWAFSRDAVDDCSISSTDIKAGSKIAISPFCTHRNPEFWARPDEFCPERFSSSEGKRTPGAYLPFGAGPRQCLGRNFATLVLRTVLATLVRECRFELANNSSDVRWRAGVFLTPIGKTEMIFTRSLEGRHRE